MTDAIQSLTLDEFIAFTQQPENEDRLFEFIEGEVHEVSPGRTYNSEIGDLIVFEVRLFCRTHNLPCHTSSKDGAYDINGEVVAPDFAYKTTPTSKEYPDPAPPLLAVEIISPTDKAQDIRRKRQVYIQAGILYWEMYPNSESIDVYPPGQPMKTLGIDDVLDGGDVLPGFSIAVRDLFPKEDEDSGSQ
jgi:Uma2 family endonuclease